MFGCLNVYASYHKVFYTMHILFRVFNILIYGSHSFKGLFKAFPQRLIWLVLININYCLFSRVILQSLVNVLFYSSLILIKYHVSNDLILYQFPSFLGLLLIQTWLCLSVVFPRHRPLLQVITTKQSDMGYGSSIVKILSSRNYVLRALCILRKIKKQVNVSIEIYLGFL